jgi:hypothetical protein
MLVLDYHHWDRLKMPVVCEMFKDERCPCLKNCIIIANCTKACQPMQDYIYTNISETLSYLKEQLGMNYYRLVETDQTFKAKNIFEGLVNLRYHTVKQDDGVFEEWMCITNRFIFTMKRSYQIALNHCGVDSTARIDHFFIGM